MILSRADESSKIHMTLKLQGEQKTIGCERVQVWRGWGEDVAEVLHK